MNVYGSISTLATAHETITLSQTKLGEFPTLLHRLRLVLRATTLPGADYRLLGSRLRLKCDGTRAETRFCLSAKRTSPFKSAGASVQSTTGSRDVRIGGSNAGYTKFRGSETYWLPTPFASFPFTSPPVRRRVPSRFNWTLPHGDLAIVKGRSPIQMY